MKVTGRGLRLSASDLAGYLSCAHRTFLDYEAAHDRLERPDWRDPHIEALRKRGDEHEREYLEHLRASGLGVVELDSPGPEARDRTLGAMRDGAPAIYQPTLARDGLFGLADVLLRTERPSKLGGWSYEVVDAKLARETRAGAILQICLYSDLLSDLQGVHPEWMFVVRPGVDFVPERYRYEDFAAYYRGVLGRLLDFVDPAPEPAYPEPVTYCTVCAWSSACRTRRRDDDHLSLVAGIHRRSGSSSTPAACRR